MASSPRRCAPLPRRSALRAAVALCGAIASGMACLAGAAAQAAATAVVERAAPEDEAQARALFDSGVEMARQQRWPEAEALFRRSHALVPRRSTAYNLALTLLHAGRGRETLAVLDEIERGLQENDHYRDQLPAMRTRALELVARIPLRVSPEGAVLSLNGADVAGEGSERELILDPGEHELGVRAAGYVSEVRHFSARAGEVTPLSIALEPLPDSATGAGSAPGSGSALPADGPSYAGPITLAAAGGALLVGAAVTGLLSLSADSGVDELCPDKACVIGLGEREDMALQTKVDRLERRRDDLALAADLLLLGGSVALGAALTWALLTGSADAPRLEVGPDRVGIAQRWRF